MAELVHFYPGLGPGDYWRLTGYELKALLEWRTSYLDAQVKAKEDARARSLDDALSGR